MAIQLKKAGYEVPLVIIIDSYSYSLFAKEPFKMGKNLFKLINGNILYPILEEIFELLLKHYYSIKSRNWINLNK